MFSDSTEQLVWCLMYMWSMLYVISVTCYLMCICVYTSYHCELVVGLRVQFCTLLEVWGVWELGCWHLTRKRLVCRGPRGSKYRWSWSMITYHIHTHTCFFRSHGRLSLSVNKTHTHGPYRLITLSWVEYNTGLSWVELSTTISFVLNSSQLTGE